MCYNNANITPLKSWKMPYIKESFSIATPLRAYEFLMRNLHLNMADAQRYINKGRVFYEGQVLTQKNQILQNCAQVLVFKPDSLGLKPLFENEDFAIFNKPSKMLIHPKGAFAHHSLIDEIRALYGKEAGLAHRIDKETSGLVLVGKHKNSVAKLGEMFIQGAVQKEYLAVVRGVLKDCDFTLSLPLATQPKGGDLCVRSRYFGEPNTESLKFKEAQTTFETLGIVGTHYTLMKIVPKTGRTHQIRVHLYALGIPILGDPLYGAQDAHSREYLDCEFITQEGACPLNDSKRTEYFGAARLMLHAYRLQFCYDNQWYAFVSSENFAI